MAHYIVRARLKPERADELRRRLAVGAYEDVKPFGRGLSYSLKHARREPDTDAVVWEVQCFCTPPLAAERPAILDRYFAEIETEAVSKGEGWERIQDFPRLWEPSIP